ncbi:putative MFS family arabinose efflux permease [Stella humosa]|uniref:Putative MFS family arabinose efflux permease n=1 Tax=Stella humosa TaxID=94 RepID=A0A3N1KQ18_9PROT|nr:MFS transporter [Stella humosa]ROP81387.1 putative MFS family arabinose efflux permease [Stella humosa]BBK32738.1 MFS transporter [Stella humosa]
MNPVRRGTVWALGVSQLVGWGVTYYLIGALGPLMVADLGWGAAVVHGGFSAALVTMGLASAPIGRLLDRHGGRPVMAAGSCLSAAACVALALADGIALYYAAWIALGIAMRMMLYDAAFAALARIGGRGARRSISQITLLGGLASTVFWPIGYYLGAAFGWRGAVLAYAAIALATLPLHLAIPAGRAVEEGRAGGGPVEAPPPAGRLPAFLYALIVTITAFLASAMSAHMIAILAGLGMGATLAVWVSALRGVGQSLARLAEVLFGGRMHVLTLAVLATGLLPLGFAAGVLGGEFAAAAIAFAIVYGSGNGLATIVRGALPLVLFDPRRYGALAGKLVAPSFLLAAAAPVAYAAIIEHAGSAAALWFSAALGLVLTAAAWELRRRYLPAAG